MQLYVWFFFFRCLGPAKAVRLGTRVDHRGVAGDIRLRVGLQELLQPELGAVHVPLPSAGRDERVVGGLRANELPEPSTMETHVNPSDRTQTQ